MDKSKIAILTTVNNFKLYNKSAALYPADIQSYVIDGRNGMFGIHSLIFMMKKFKNKDIEWLILMDEDALFINSDLIFPLINEMKNNNYLIAGVRDGGVLPERSGNPHAMNPFFSVIDLQKLKILWNKNQMLSNHYINDNEFDDDLSELVYPYDIKSMSEPYYCFYFWLKRLNQKFLYLNVTLPFKDDRITNTVQDMNGNAILYHTWFSREYGGYKQWHTDRIDAIFKLFDQNGMLAMKPIIFKDLFFPLKDRLRKFKKNFKKRFRLKM